MMGPTAFLNSSGAIVAPVNGYTPGFAAFLPVDPYLEAVTVPVVSVDPTALYGEHPEDLARVTYTSGAALTFFVDSIAGGDDSSGKGTADDPWRSLKTARKFLQCTACVLNTACKYVQIKVRGTVDYNPAFSSMQYGSCAVILAGWGGVCDLGTATYDAEYGIGLVGRQPARICSGCVVTSGRVSAAVACLLSSVTVDGAAVDCSGGNIAMYRSSSVIYGGSYSAQVSAAYVYDTHITAADIGSRNALGSCIAAVSATIMATNVLSGTAVSECSATAVKADYLGDCTVSVTAIASGGQFCSVFADVVGGAAIVSGGRFYASAAARASAAGSSRAAAVAYAQGFSEYATVHGAQVTLGATASATASAASATEIELTENIGTSCYISRVFYYSAGGVVSSSVVSSGSC